MGGGISSNLHAIFFEINGVLTKYENRENSLEIDIGSPSETAINGCGFITDDGKTEPPQAALGRTIRPWAGGSGTINLNGIQVDGHCDDQSDKILDNENYFSTCFLVPKDLKINDNDGMNTDISDKCKLVYKIELKCEGDDTEDTEETTEETTEEDTEETTEETVEESFTNFKNDNDIQCIFTAAIILFLFILIKRKNF